MQEFKEMFAFFGRKSDIVVMKSGFATAAISAVLLVAASFTCNAGKIVTDSLQSKVLGAEVKYNVYLPTGFDPASDEKYPVIYLLHGFTDNYDAWAVKGNMKLVADELMESGEARRTIIVMPNAGDPDVENIYNGYFNMPGWNYEDFFFNEFLPLVEQKYNVIGDKGHRAVMGLSMGGGGSTVYCQRHPDMFSSCYAMSAWLHSEGASGDGRKGKSVYTSDAVNRLSALNFMENADEATLAKMRTVKWFFDCGDDDFLLEQNVKMHFLMRKCKVKDEFRVRDGIHNWEYWHVALRTSLPFASRNFEK